MSPADTWNAVVAPFVCAGNLSLPSTVVPNAPAAIVVGTADAAFASTVYATFGMSPPPSTSDMTAHVRPSGAESMMSRPSGNAWPMLVFLIV